MKTTSRSLNISRILVATLAIAITCGVSAPSAQAGYIVTFQQSGSNVVATGSGTIDLSGLSFGGTLVGAVATVIPFAGYIQTGPTSAPTLDIYTGFSGPMNLGSGLGKAASSGNGDFVGIQGFANVLLVPQGYVSGAPLSSSATWDNATFSSLGLTPGTYTWTWGSGAGGSLGGADGSGADGSFGLDIVASTTVPDSGSTFGLLLLSLATLFGASRFRSPSLA